MKYCLNISSRQRNIDRISASKRNRENLCRSDCLHLVYTYAKYYWLYTFVPSEKLCTLGIIRLQGATPCTQVKCSNMTLKVESILTLTSSTKDNQIIRNIIMWSLPAHKSNQDARNWSCAHTETICTAQRQRH